jgi:uncharacterized protein (TIGR02001 family)
MNKWMLAVAAAFAMTAMPAMAADIPVKAAPVVVAAPSPWDFAFGSAVASDYVWRGVTQSNHKPSVAAYFEPRYSITKDVQLYAGFGGASIDFPNRAAAEIDIYGGIRPTFDKLSLDLGVWYYWYPGGQCFSAIANGNTVDCVQSGGTVPLPLPNLNAVKDDFSFVEFFARANYAVTDAFSVGGYVYYSPSVLNTGADGVFFGGLAKYAFPALAYGVQPYVSGGLAYWSLGTTDSFYACFTPTCLVNSPNGIKLASYATWDVGVGFTYKVFTLDLRYTDTDLSKAECNAFTGDHTAVFSPSGITNINGGNLSNWCGARFTARLSADLTVNTNLK